MWELGGIQARFYYGRLGQEYQGRSGSFSRLSFSVLVKRVLIGEPWLLIGTSFMM